MSKNYILSKKNYVSKEECNLLIKELKNKVKPGEHKSYGYEAFDLEGTPIINQVQQKIFPLWQEYINKFPEVNLTHNKWSLTHMRFKKLMRANRLKTGTLNIVTIVAQDF